MRVRLSWAAVAVAIAGSSYGFTRPHAVAVAAPTTTHHDQTTIDDQTDLSLTVYNSDLALVRDGYRAAGLVAPTGVDHHLLVTPRHGVGAKHHG